jgi:hypothetical protein
MGALHAHHPEDAIPDREPLDAVTDAVDRSADVAPDHGRELVGHEVLHEARCDRHVERVHRRRMDSDRYLAGTGDGIRDVDHRDRNVERLQRERLHRSSSPRVCQEPKEAPAVFRATDGHL